MNVDQLMVALTKSAEDHDENTGESNGDLVAILRIALETLKHDGLIEQFLDNLRDEEISEIPEFEWLVPATGYILVTDGSDTRFVFELLKARGYDRAAATVQNSGRVPLADFHRALEEIEATGEKGQHPANVYRNYINEHAVLGKEA
jgi:hypothetical protein